MVGCMTHLLIPTVVDFLWIAVVSIQLVFLQEPPHYFSNMLVNILPLFKA